MFDYQTFTPRVHDLVHSFADVFRSLSFVLSCEFYATLDFFQTLFHILLPKRSRTMEKRLAIQVEQIKNFDCTQQL